MADQSLTILVNAVDNASAKLRQVQGVLAAMQKAAGGAAAGATQVSTATSILGVSLTRLKQFAGAYAALKIGRTLVQEADAWMLLGNRIRIFSESEADMQASREKVYRTAQETRSSLEATGALYTRLSLGAKRVGLSQQEMLKVTKTVNQAFIVSGATAEEARNAVIQLAQGFQSGKLQGDELRAVFEQAPRLVQGMSEALGVSMGELRKMGAEGTLQPKLIAEAIVEMSKKVDKEFKRMQSTMGQAWTQVENAFTRMVGKFNEATNAGRGVVIILTQIYKNLENLGNFFDSDMGKKVLEGIVQIVKQGPFVPGGPAAAMQQAELERAREGGPLPAAEDLYTPTDEYASGQPLPVRFALQRYNDERLIAEEKARKEAEKKAKREAEERAKQWAELMKRMTFDRWDEMTAQHVRETGNAAGLAAFTLSGRLGGRTVSYGGGGGLGLAGQGPRLGALGVLPQEAPPWTYLGGGSVFQGVQPSARATEYGRVTDELRQREADLADLSKASLEALERATPEAMDRWEKIRGQMRDLREEADLLRAAQKALAAEPEQGTMNTRFQQIGQAITRYMHGAFEEAKAAWVAFRQSLGSGFVQINQAVAAGLQTFHAGLQDAFGAFLFGSEDEENVKDAVGWITQLQDAIGGLSIEELTGQQVGDWINGVTEILEGGGDQAKALEAYLNSMFEHALSKPLPEEVADRIKRLRTEMLGLLAEPTEGRKGDLLADLTDAIADFSRRGDLLNRFKRFGEDVWKSIKGGLETALTDYLAAGATGALMDLAAGFFTGLFGTGPKELGEKAAQDIKDGLSSVGTKIGEVVQWLATPLTATISLALQVVQDWPEAVWTVVEGAGTVITQTIQAVLSTVGSWAQGVWDLVSGVIPSGAQWQYAFNATLNTLQDWGSDVWALVQQVPGLQTWDYLFRASLEKVAGGVEWLWGLLAAGGGAARYTIQAFASYLAGAVGWLWDIFKAGAGAARYGIEAVVSAAQGTLAWLWDILKGTARTAIYAIRATADAVAGTVAWLWDILKGTVGGASYAISATAGAVAGTVGWLWDILKGTVRGAGYAISATADAVAGTVAWLWDILKGTARTAIYAIRATADTVMGVVGWLWDILKGTTRAAGYAINATADAVAGAVAWLWDILKGTSRAAGYAISATADAVVGVVGWLWDILKGAARTAGYAIRATVDTVAGTVGWLWDILKGTVRTATYAISATLNFVSDVTVGALKTVWDLLTGGDEPVTKTISVAVGADALAEVKNAFGPDGTLGQAIGDYFSGEGPFGKGFSDNLGSAVKAGFAAAGIASLFSPQNTVGAGIGAAIGSLVGQFVAGKLGSAIGSVLGGVGGTLLGMFNDMPSENQQRYGVQELAVAIQKSGGIQAMAAMPGGMGSYLNTQGFTKAWSGLFESGADYLKSDFIRMIMAEYGIGSDAAGALFNQWRDQARSSAGGTGQVIPPVPDIPILPDLPPVDTTGTAPLTFSRLRMVQGYGDIGTNSWFYGMNQTANPTESAVNQIMGAAQALALSQYMVPPYFRPTQSQAASLFRAGPNGSIAVPYYERGGWVPGPIGQPRVAVVHGGEFVQPVGGAPGPGGAASFTIHFNIYGNGDAELVRMMRERVLPELQRNVEQTLQRKARFGQTEFDARMLRSTLS